ncbi:hypothetical protein EVAR_17802_1 [Eumeta japonica]|uniref:Uncharacterized protein n=1 Tax=Eumeta variegata TaxID=151549 RepID=A0A4C1TTT5_EUMVA|nr:hypothetical protein EVAR_17802_1 [Eumeta japonica]
MILNVLVSKTLKRAEYIQALLELVSTKHANEPISVQASFVRSLVRRAAAYRLPDEPWQIFYGMVWRIIFQSEEHVPCEEGLHAILIHNILNNLDTAPEVTEKFNTLFDPLVEYDLTSPEKLKVCDYLYQMLLNSLETCLQNNSYEDASGLMYNLLHLLRAHQFSIKTRPEVLCVVKKIAERDLKSCRNILQDLYNAKIGRDLFTRENFILRQNEESYLNALRHDVTLVIDTDAFDENVINSDQCKFSKFFTTLKLYFEELAPKYLLIIENKIQPHNELSSKLAAGLCILQEPAVLWTIIKGMYAEGKEKHQLAERLAANVHLSWSPAHIRGEIHMLPRLLAGPAPFVRLALTLALDRLLPFDILKIVAQLRRGHNTQIKQFLLKRFYKYINVKCDNIPPEVWQEFKTLMIEMIPHYNIKLWSLICDVDAIANAFKMEYCMTIVRITSSENFKLNKVKGLVQTFRYINDNIERASKDKILDILQNFLKNDFHSLNFITLCEDYDFDCLVRIKITILVRFLLTCETEKVQREALDNVAKPFLHTVGASWHHKLIREYFELFLYGLKYYKAYLDMRYVSNTPVFEVILTFMRTFLDVKEYFHLYCRVHLTMIYRETLKRLQERHPNVLAEPAGKTEAAAAVGAVLAGYLAREHRQLRVHYFPAITDIYARELCYYIKHYGFGSGAVSRKFEISLVRGLIASDDDEDVYLAALLFFCLQWHQTSYLKDPDIRKILTLFENSKCVKV